MGNVVAEIAEIAHTVSPLPIGQCKACERMGIPILPLREVITAPALKDTSWLEGDSRYDNPPWGQNHATPLCEAVQQASRQIRTLRTGYLYVILDKRAAGKGGSSALRTLEAYSVNAQGHLRYFNPYAPQYGDPPPLPERCTTEGHDVKASFINVNPERYHTAWLAFANDPMPPNALQDYRDGKHLVERFTRVDLDAIKAGHNPVNPEGILTATDINYLYNNVPEYGKNVSASFYSLHPFNWRFPKLAATKNYIANTLKAYESINLQGIAAITLLDPTGEALELNYLRHGVLLDYKKWQSHEPRLYLQRTSIEIAKIKAYELHQAFEEADQGVIGTFHDATVASLPPERARQAIEERQERLRNSTEIQNAAQKRLTPYCDMTARDGFNRNYSAWANLFIDAINGITQQYVATFENNLFQIAVRYDYANDDAQNLDQRISADCFTRLIARVLEGGPSDLARYAANDNAHASLGALHVTELKDMPSIDLWQSLLEDNQSLYHQALLRRNPALMQGVQKALTEQQTAIDTYQNSPKEAQDQLQHATTQLAILYNTIGGTLKNIDSLHQWREDRLLRTINTLLASANSAIYNISAHQGISTPLKYTRTLPYAVLLYHGQPVITTQTALTAKEFRALLGEVKRTVQYIDTTARTEAGRIQGTIASSELAGVRSRNWFAITVDDRVQWQHFQQVRIDPQEIPAKILESGDEAQIRQAVEQHVRNNREQYVSPTDDGNDSALPGKRQVRALLRMLMPDVTVQADVATSAQTNQSTPDKPAQQQTTAEVSSRNRQIGSATLSGSLDAVSLIFLLQSLHSGIQAIDSTLGKDHAAAVLGYYTTITGIAATSMGMTGAGIDGVLAWRSESTLARYSTAATLAENLKRNATLITAFSSAIDACGAYVKHLNAAQNKELQEVQDYYLYSSACYSVSAAAGALSIAMPVIGGIAVLVFATAGAVLALAGDKLRRTPLQSWLDRCAFGKAERGPDTGNSIEGFTYQWKEHRDMETAFHALNAAWMGLSPQLALTQQHIHFYESSNAVYSLKTIHVKSLVTLPPTPDRAAPAYSYVLYAHLSGAGNRSLVLASANSGNAPQPLTVPASTALANPSSNDFSAAQNRATHSFAPAIQTEGDPRQSIHRPFIREIDENKDYHNAPLSPEPIPTAQTELAIRHYHVIDINPENLLGITAHIRYWQDASDTGNFAEVRVCEFNRKAVFRLVPAIVDML